MADSPSEIAVKMNSLRWSKTTAAERQAIIAKLNAARLKKQREKGTLRAQTPKRRSRKAQTRKP